MQNKKKEIEAYPKSKAKTMHFKEEGKNVKQLNNNNNKKNTSSSDWIKHCNGKKLIKNSIQLGQSVKKKTLAE